MSSPPSPPPPPPPLAAPFHADYISSINEVKQWLNYKNLEEFVYLLVDHGYDDLAAIARSTTARTDLVALFTAAESRTAIQHLIDAIQEVGIDLYRQSNLEFRRCLETRQANMNAEGTAAQVAHARRTSGLYSKPPLTEAGAAASIAAIVGTPASSAMAVSASATAAASPAVAAPASPANSSSPSPSSPTAVAATNSNATARPNTTSAAAATPASPSSPPTAAMLNPTAGFDVSQWEGAIHFQAYLHSIQCYAKAFDEPILATVELETKLLAGRSQVHLSKIKSNLATLVTGCVFKKYKRGSAVQRLIWVTRAYDFLAWGAEDKSLVKGCLPTCEIQEVNQGFAAKNKNRIYVVSPERTLELEARDQAQALEWKQMLEMLIQLNMSELEQKQLLQGGSAPTTTPTAPAAAAAAAAVATPVAAATQSAFQLKFAKAKAEYIKLLSTGSVFKKLPPADAIMSSPTTRLLWSPANPVDRLQWGDLLTKKVLGFILLQDVVEVREHPSEALKFTIHAIKRTLDLEARNEPTRERWIKAIRFMVEFKQMAMKP